MTDPVVIGAWTALFSALAGMLVAILHIIAMVKKNTATTDDTHTLLNSNHDTLVTRIIQLEKGITALGGTVPEDPAIAAAQARINES